MITLRFAELGERCPYIMFAKCFIIGIGMAALLPIAHAETRTSVVNVDAQTGKLVRRTVVSSTLSSAEPSAQPRNLTDMIDSIAAENEVEAPLVRSVIQTESNYNPAAVSNKGAQGLMQLIPSTARRFGVKDSFNSQQNVEGGVKYLKYLIDLFHGDYSRAVAAYNAGEAAVAKYGGVPPYKETRNYVAQVARRLAVQRRSFIPVEKVEPPAAASVTAETYNPVIASVSADGRVYYRTP